MVPSVPNYYIGDLRHDATTNTHRGWVVGSFMEEGLAQKNNEVEILYWEFEAGPIKHPTKISTILEVTIILKGSIAGEIDGKALVLKNGQYIVIRPGTVNNIAQKALEKVVGITIKAPSDPNAKTIIDTRVYKRVTLL